MVEKKATRFIFDPLPVVPTHCVLSVDWAELTYKVTNKNNQIICEGKIIYEQDIESP